MSDKCPDCGRRRAVSGEDWSVAYQSARRDEVTVLCGKHLPSYWSDETIPDCDQATIIHLRAQLAAALAVVAAGDRIRDPMCDGADDKTYDTARAELARLMGEK